MPTYGPRDAEVLVFTFKHGLLSAMAHDLKLRATSFEVEVDEEHRRVRAKFDPASLRVVSAMRDGNEVMKRQESASAPSPQTSTRSTASEMSPTSVAAKHAAANTKPRVRR